MSETLTRRRWLTIQALVEGVDLFTATEGRRASASGGEVVVTVLCAHHAAVVASTIRAVPRLEPDERDRLADDLARQCNQCTHAKEKPCP